jgi:hypothetical protein
MSIIFEENKNAKHKLDALYGIWLGKRDSNPRMPGPKPGALPLGDSPILWIHLCVTERFYRISRHYST